MKVKRGRQDHAGSLTAIGAWYTYIYRICECVRESFFLLVCVCFLSFLPLLRVARDREREEGEEEWYK